MVLDQQQLENYLLISYANILLFINMNMNLNVLIFQILTL